uniref:Uncharacterized protein n=1 Tax=Utricularia reniformis TaxID=192314 RepID=A0A1Y0B297_9LAMI|nr:hypothetical protein AEK19_MT1273 [Utricularia reniformis]ART31479.1 hypothetical protein AEK19_MT1273 [Utricularia reniformis]
MISVCLAVFLVLMEEFESEGNRLIQQRPWAGKKVFQKSYRMSELYPSCWILYLLITLLLVRGL